MRQRERLKEETQAQCVMELGGTSLSRLFVDF